MAHYSGVVQSGPTSQEKSFFRGMVCRNTNPKIQDSRQTIHPIGALKTQERGARTGNGVRYVTTSGCGERSIDALSRDLNATRGRVLGVEVALLLERTTCMYAAWFPGCPSIAASCCSRLLLLARKAQQSRISRGRQQKAKHEKVAMRAITDAASVWPPLRGQLAWMVRPSAERYVSQPAPAADRAQIRCLALELQLHGPSHRQYWSPRQRWVVISHCWGTTPENWSDKSIFGTSGPAR